MSEPVDLKVAAGKGLRSVLFLLAGMILLVVAVAQTELGGQAVEELFHRLATEYLVAAFAIMTCGIWFLALRWRSLMPGDVRHVRVSSLAVLLLIGTLLNYALPGPVGEFVAAAMAGRRFKLTTESALAAGIHARFVGLGVAGAVALFLMLVADMPLPEDYQGWVYFAAGFIGVGVVGLAVLSSRPELLRLVSRHTAGRIGFLKSLDESVGRFCDALSAVGGLGVRRYALASLWALCGHGCIIGGILIAGYGLGADPSIPGLAFTYAVATAGAVVLFAFPGSQVGWDGMLAGLMVATAGVALPNALALALLVRVQQLALVCLGALALLVQGDMAGQAPEQS